MATVETNYAVKIADYIDEFKEEYSLSHDDIAERMGVTRAEFDEIFSATRLITDDEAQKIATATDTKSHMWLKLDAQYWKDARRLNLV